MLEKTRISYYMPLGGKQKYQVTKLAWRAKLSRLLLQRIIEFKMNENQRKTRGVINLYVIFWTLNENTTLKQTHCKGEKP